MTHSMRQERVETTRGVSRPEAMSVLHAVFDLIRSHDAKHFADMCAAQNPLLLGDRVPNLASGIEGATA